MKTKKPNRAPAKVKAPARTFIAVSPAVQRQLRYAYGQHELVCEDLGCSPSADEPGPTAHEAVQAMKCEVLHLRLAIANLRYNRVVQAVTRGRGLRQRPRTPPAKR